MAARRTTPDRSPWYFELVGHGEVSPHAACPSTEDEVRPLLMATVGAAWARGRPAAAAKRAWLVPAAGFAVVCVAALALRGLLPRRAGGSGHEEPPRVLVGFLPSAQPQDCRLNASDRQKLLLLTSTALANPNLKRAFREMVLRLPDSAWARPEDEPGTAAGVKILEQTLSGKSHSNGRHEEHRLRFNSTGGSSSPARAKAQAAAKSALDVVAAGFHEPELYSGLNVLIIEDPSFFKNSMWDPSNPEFATASGVNYQTLGFITNSSLVREATDGFKGLDGGGGCNYESADCGGLGGFGFDRGAMVHVSIFDLCATDAQKRAALALQSKGLRPVVPMGPVDEGSKCGQQFLSLLRSADVVAVQGGNPDWAGFIFRKFAPALLRKVVERVEDGTLIYLGRSAGAMVASSDFALTYEPTPGIRDFLLGGETAGLALAGVCAIRPHYERKWDLISNMYEKVTSENVLKVPNGEGLVCLDGECAIVGAKSAEGPSAFANGDTLNAHVDRLVDAFATAFGGQPKPQGPVFYPAPEPSGPACAMDPASEGTASVLLTGSGLAHPALKAAFRAMVLKLPDSAWATPAAAQAAKSRPPVAPAAVEAAGFLEPALYGGLRVLVLEDPSFLRNAVWDPSNKDFANNDGMNYQKGNFSTSPQLVSLWTSGFKGMDGGWARNYESSACGGLGGLGFDVGAFTHVSIFDLCATNAQKSAAFKLQSRGVKPEIPMGPVDGTSQCAQTFLALLGQAAVLAVQGGNPDWARFVLKDFAPMLAQQIVSRVRNGSLIYLGRGAGAIVGGADITLAYEPSPGILVDLLHRNTSGLRLAGRCAVRPNYTDDKVWDYASTIYEHVKGTVDVVRVPIGEGLGCMSAKCQIYGATSKEGKATLDGPDTVSTHAGRLEEALKAAFDKYNLATA